MKNHHNLNTLDISENSIGARGFEHILELFQQNHPIKSLLASNNKISGSDIQIGELLKHNNHLETLDISENEIANELGQRLATQLQDSYFLKLLDITGN